MIVQRVATAISPNNNTTKSYNVILLHGLFGNLSNWSHVSKSLSEEHTIHIPKLPLFEISLTENRLDSLVSFLRKYIKSRDLDKVVLIGNSLGGHIALLYTLKFPQDIERLVLTGSSGLYENSFSGSFPRVKDFGYIKERVSFTFYKKEVITESLLNEVYSTIQNPSKTLSIISLARAAQRHNLGKQLHQIKLPVLLVWGLQDEITPPAVAIRFDSLLPLSELKFIDQCGHVPMMEQPELFNIYVKDFLERE